MKRPRVLKAIAVVLIVFSFLLTGCGDADWDLLFDFFLVWAEENNVFSGDSINPAGLAQAVGKDITDNWLNTLENTQLDGLGVVQTVEKANSIADEAITDLDTEKIQEAISLRPYDWQLHEKDALIWGAKNNIAAADSAISQADNLLRESLQPGDDCVQARRAQLHLRMAITWDEIQRQENATPGYMATGLREIYLIASDEISKIDNHGLTDFCP